ncbi:MAG: tRNA uridine-5-carboxymethylaminomethyl(34) synthesis GTPase MnmE [Mycoplasmatota bacterium]
MNETICAIATASGSGSISIIRVSGDESIKTVSKIFRGKNLENVETHTINYGHIIADDKVIDEVLVTVMHAPRTFTMEDVVEINCHGGIYTTKKILEELLNQGCSLAQPGEFSKRAYLNGRIDLIEAQGIMNLIEAKSEKSRELAISEISGKVTKLITNLREKIIEIVANIEVNIDYPEYDDIEQLTNEKILPNIKIIKEQISKILKESNDGKIIQEGIKTVIIGRPNAGKSSLLNNLLDNNKAIVTNIPGTTRDIVEGNITIDGILLNLIDTAGIRKTDEIVEKIGIEKSLRAMREADLVLFVFNNNEEINEEEKTLLKEVKDKKHIILINKIDLEKKLNYEFEEFIEISALKNIGIELLKEKIIKLFNLEKLEQQDMTYLTNARSLSILKRVYNLINEVEDGITKEMPIDMIEIDLRNIWKTLGEITGETYEEELIDQLFSRFCLGK